MAETQIAKFKSGDGVEHHVVVGSPVYQKLVKEGFERIDKPAKKGRAADAETDAEADEDLSKLNRDQLIAKAAELGLTFNAEDKAQTKKIIIAAIEAELSETGTEEDEDETPQ